MDFDQESARQTAREVVEEFTDALEEGVRAAVPAFLKLVTVGVVAYLAAKATQRTIAALKVAVAFGVVAHAVSALAGLSGAAFVTTGLWHVGALAVLAALSGHDLPFIGVTVATPGVAFVVTAAYWTTITTTAVGLLFAIGGVMGSIAWGILVDEMAKQRGYI